MTCMWSCNETSPTTQWIELWVFYTSNFMSGIWIFIPLTERFKAFYFEISVNEWKIPFLYMKFHTTYSSIILLKNHLHTITQLPMQAILYSL